MKFQLIALSACVLGCLVVASLATDDQTPKESDAVQSASTRAGFKMPKLFDFQAFKEKYNKHYANAAELARRSKLFMARAFNVFISAVKYMYKKSTKYLRINPRSDWTEQERYDITNDLIVDKTDSFVVVKSGETPLQVADPEDVKRTLADIVEHKHENAEFAAIAAELEAAKEHKRKRRSVQAEPTRRRSLSMEQLMGETVNAKVSPKYTPSVPSNNPDYEQLQAFSEGADDDDESGEQVQPIPMTEAALIDQQATQGGYLSYLVGSLKSAASNFFEANSEGEEDTDEDEEMIDAFEEVTQTNPDRVYLDYRDTNCFLQPKDQLSCGACYAFTTIAVMEYHHCLQTGQLVPFSEQYIVDCGKQRVGPSGHIKGCQGGQPSVVANFVSQYGLELSADYPYKSKELVCPYHPDLGSKHMGHSKVDDVEVVLIWERKLLKPEMVQYLLETRGPLFFGIFTMPDFSDFGGGIDLLRCDPNKKTGHAMVLIGHGIEDGIEYWLVRNSHGINFGLQGHYKVAKDIREGCLAQVGYARGKFKQNRHYKGRTVFDELKKSNLLAKFAPKA